MSFTAISKPDFLRRLREIEAEQPTYRIGGHAEDGTCDCIGLIRAAAERAGLRWRWVQSSNEARTLCKSICSVDNGLTPLMLVMKARKQGESGYSLPARYKTADRLDYYHIGVVVSVEPLDIMHCTNGGIRHDSKIGRWSHAGEAVFLEDGADGGADPQTIPQTQPHTARITAENGKPVKARAKPSRLCRLWWRLPIGTPVTVIRERADGWTEAIWGGRTVYIMTRFLERG